MFKIDFNFQPFVFLVRLVFLVSCVPINSHLSPLWIWQPPNVPTAIWPTNQQPFFPFVDLAVMSMISASPDLIVKIKSIWSRKSNLNQICYYFLILATKIVKEQQIQFPFNFLFVYLTVSLLFTERKIMCIVSVVLSQFLLPKLKSNSNLI